MVVENNNKINLILNDFVLKGGIEIAHQVNYKQVALTGSQARCQAIQTSEESCKQTESRKISKNVGKRKISAK